jgi:hypothetical protein
MSGECLCCGMLVAAGIPVCPKCDALLLEQTDGSVLHRDIAHQHETVEQAVQKLEQALNDCRQSHACAVRLAVGRGVIREEVMRHLSWLAMSGKILDFDHDEGNTGAIMVTLRKAVRRGAAKPQGQKP